MTVQNLYTQYLEGKITKQKFLYEVRRDQNLTMISPNNSFDDVVKILKNKSIISEKAHKESTGKQEVEIIAKTIDMVNPYQYSKGMEYELGIMDIPATSGDLSEENIAKAQKKVLANLTKNPSYYSEKICGKGEVSEEWVEVTKKEMDKIGKGKSKMIREGAINSDYKYIYKVIKSKYPEIVGNFDMLKSFVDMHIDDIEITDKTSIIDEFENYISANPEALNLDALEEHGEYFDRVSDMNISQSPLEEKKLRIYEKYAKKMGKTVDEVKSMVDEAIALKDRAGNIQYAKDSTEASNIEKNAKSKGITLTKTAV
jgi:hypothetical protein